MSKSGAEKFGRKKEEATEVNPAWKPPLSGQNLGLYRDIKGRLEKEGEAGADQLLRLDLLLRTVARKDASEAFRLFLGKEGLSADVETPIAVAESDPGIVEVDSQSIETQKEISALQSLLGDIKKADFDRIAAVSEEVDRFLLKLRAHGNLDKKEEDILDYLTAKADQIKKDIANRKEEARKPLVVSREQIGNIVKKLMAESPDMSLANGPEIEGLGDSIGFKADIVYTYKLGFISLNIPIHLEAKLVARNGELLVPKETIKIGIEDKYKNKAQDVLEKELPKLSGKIKENLAANFGQNRGPIKSLSIKDGQIQIGFPPDTSQSFGPNPGYVLSVKAKLIEFRAILEDRLSKLSGSPIENVQAKKESDPIPPIILTSPDFAKSAVAAGVVAATGEQKQTTEKQENVDPGAVKPAETETSTDSEKERLESELAEIREKYAKAGDMYREAYLTARLELGNHLIAMRTKELEDAGKDFAEVDKEIMAYRSGELRMRLLVEEAELLQKSKEEAAPAKWKKTFVKVAEFLNKIPRHKRIILSSVIGTLVFAGGGAVLGIGASVSLSGLAMSFGKRLLTVGIGAPVGAAIGKGSGMIYEKLRGSKKKELAEDELIIEKMRDVFSMDTLRVADEEMTKALAARMKRAKTKKWVERGGAFIGGAGISMLIAYEIGQHLPQGEVQPGSRGNNAQEFPKGPKQHSGGVGKLKPAEIGPRAVEMDGVFEVHKGDNLWNMLKDRLDSNGALKGMSEQQKNYVLDSIEDKLRALKPEELEKMGFKAGDIDKYIHPGDRLDLSAILKNKTGMDEILARAQRISHAVPPEHVATASPDAKVLESTVETPAPTAKISAATESLPTNTNAVEHTAGETRFYSEPPADYGKSLNLSEEERYWAWNNKGYRSVTAMPDEIHRFYVDNHPEPMSHKVYETNYGQRPRGYWRHRGGRYIDHAPDRYYRYRRNPFIHEWANRHPGRGMPPHLFEEFQRLNRLRQILHPEFLPHPKALDAMLRFDPFSHEFSHIKNVNVGEFLHRVVDPSSPDMDPWTARDIHNGSRTVGFRTGNHFRRVPLTENHLQFRRWLGSLRLTDEMKKMKISELAKIFGREHN